MNWDILWDILEVHEFEFATGIQAPAGTCKLMNIASTNCIKCQMLHVFLM